MVSMPSLRFLVAPPDEAGDGPARDLLPGSHVVLPFSPIFGFGGFDFCSGRATKSRTSIKSIYVPGVLGVLSITDRGTRSPTPRTKFSISILDRMSEDPRSDNPVHVWDFSLSEKDVERPGLIAVLRDVGKKWAFQLETANDGYVHYQGRFSLKAKSRWPKKAFDDAGFKAIHLTVTSKENRDNDWYVTKSETWTAGPWKDTDPVPPKLTHQLVLHQEKGDLHAWEASLLVIARTWTMRDINVVVAKGGEGKSLFCEFMEYNSNAYEIPPFNDWKDMARVCFDVPDQKCYLIDMPRAMNKFKLQGFYAGVETLKNGTVFDERYTFKKRRMDRPQIIVFTNIKPDVTWMTRDRWIFHTISDTQTLVPLLPEHPFSDSDSDHEGPAGMDLAGL